MTHVFALAGDDELTAHGLAALRGDFRDARARRLVLAGRRAGRQARLRPRLRRAGGGERRATASCWREALEVLDTRFWDERAGALVDSAAATGRWLEPYRGANANMHGVEAMVAAGDPVARAGGGSTAALRRRPAGDRALRRRLAAAAALQPRRPGAPVPALRRDARARVRVGAARARARASSARRGGCSRRASPRAGTASGFVYTVDWDGRPVVRDQLQLGAVRGDRGRRGAGRARARAAVVGARRAGTSSTARAAAGG